MSLQEIGSVSDYWCNDYFDPVLRRRDGKREKISGYCTDIFVEQAIAWMRTQHEAHKPFLCYLPFNVCHGPQWAPAALREDIAREFPELTPGQVGYLAMLANADGNIGRLEQSLQDAGLRENTIVIFISDNGGYALVGKYNAGMRDGKSRLAEGGHHRCIRPAPLRCVLCHGPKALRSGPLRRVSDAGWRQCQAGRSNTRGQAGAGRVWACRIARGARTVAH